MHTAWTQGAVGNKTVLGPLGTTIRPHLLRSDRIIPDDPETQEYLSRLIAAILNGRTIVLLYHVILVLFVLCLAFIRWGERRKRTSERVEMSLSKGGESRYGPEAADNGLRECVGGEQSPLLSAKRARPSRLTRASWTVSAWLMRQPTPLPVTGRVLPENGVTVFVGCWMALNVCLHLAMLPLRWSFFFAFADRAGLIFIVNLPLLYLLATKNQPLKFLTGYSYEALNIFHRHVGELMCLEAVVHFAGILVWEWTLAPEWLRLARTGEDFFRMPMIIFGLGALTCYGLLYLTSLAAVRARFYEFFLSAHVFLQAVALAFLWLHFHTSRPYVAISLAIFIADRFIWRLRLKSTSMTADIRILDDGETVLVSADWDIPRAPSVQTSAWSERITARRNCILYGWKPTDHIFITIPALGGMQAWRAHPFTIASAAPACQPPAPASQRHVQEHPRAAHAWLSLLIRARNGFTRDLLHFASTHTRVPIRIDGPYGSTHAFDMLRASSCAILVAGGSGIAVMFPLAWALLHDAGAQDRHGMERCDESGAEQEAALATAHQPRRVRLLWVVHARTQLSWIPRDAIDELEGLGLDVVVPPPTSEAGRPGIGRLVSEWIDSMTGSKQGHGTAGVAVSGPDGMNRAVRNACADALGKGSNVKIVVERFDW